MSSFKLSLQLQIFSFFFLTAPISSSLSFHLMIFCLFGFVGNSFHFCFALLTDKTIILSKILNNAKFTILRFDVFQRVIYNSCEVKDFYCMLISSTSQLIKKSLSVRLCLCDNTKKKH